MVELPVFSLKRPRGNYNCKDSKKFAMTKDKDLSKTPENHKEKDESILSLSGLYPKYFEKYMDPSHVLRSMVLEIIH